MLAISLFGALFLVAVVTAAVGVMAMLLSGAPGVVTRSVRASATTGTDGAASGSGHPAPTPAARPGHPAR